MPSFEKSPSHSSLFLAPSPCCFAFPESHMHIVRKVRDRSTETAIKNNKNQYLCFHVFQEGRLRGGKYELV